MRLVGSSRRGLKASRSAVEDRRLRPLSIRLGIGALRGYDALWAAGRSRNLLEIQLRGPLSGGSALLGIAATTRAAFSLQLLMQEEH